MWLALLASTCLADTDFERLKRLAADRYGSEASQQVEDWSQMARDAKNSSERQLLSETNRFFNERILFVPDEDTWRQRDYWATPLETLGRLQGDCEDFTIAKYATLITLGVSMDKLRLVYARASIGGGRSRVTQAHMVLAYYPHADAEPLILDNLIQEILPASRRPDLRPIFSFNSEGLWVGGNRERTTSDPGARLSRWQDLLHRMHADGIDLQPEKSQ